MPPGPVGRWLETFMCKQYVDLFESYGFKTLQSVCQLQPTTVHSMGIPSEHCDKILENVSVLRQSLVGAGDSNFSDNGYGYQMSDHIQNSNYSFHSSGYISSQQHYSSNHSSQTNHGMSLQGSDPCSVTHLQYGNQNHQDVYGQPLYNNRLHPGHGVWEDSMGMYNQSSRHLMGNSPPSSVMQSPPPPPSTPSTSLAGISHYSRHFLDSHSSSTHHHTWTQGQLLSSPRATPSPGIANPSRPIPSPSLAGCSPGHGKTFSPPPYSPKPPLAHQQSPICSFEYSSIGASCSPSYVAPSNRHLSGISLVGNSSSNPLKSLQNMLLLDTQIEQQCVGSKQQQEQESHHPHQQQIHEEDSNSQQPLKLTPKFSSVEQLATSSGSSSSNSVSVISQRTNRMNVSSPSAVSIASIGKSSNIGTPSPDVQMSDSIDGDSSTSAFASNEESTADELRSSRKSVEQLHENGSSGDMTRLLSTQAKCEMSEDNNSSLDVVGHVNDSRQSSPHLLDSTTKNEVKYVKLNQEQQQNGLKSPIYSSPSNEKVNWRDDSNVVLLNGLLNENELGRCNKPNDSTSCHELISGNCNKTNISDFKEFNCPLKTKSLDLNNLRKNRRKQCLSSFGSSRLPLVYETNDHYLNESSFKVNGDRVGEEEMVELTELKTVTRVGGRKDKLFTTSALDVVHNYDQVQSSYHSVSARPFNCLDDINCDLSKNEVKSIRRKAIKTTDPRLARSCSSVRDNVGDAFTKSSMTKYVNVPKPVEKVVNCGLVLQESSFKQGSHLGVSSGCEDTSFTSVVKLSIDDRGLERVSSSEYSGSVTKSEDNLLNLKPRRGRPLGSKNKPKPPGFVKDTKKISKEKHVPVDPVLDVSSSAQTRTSLIVDVVQPISKPVTEIKVRGPYVHLSGNNRYCPASVSIINTFSKDDDVDVRVTARRNCAAFKRNSMSVCFNSTLSSNYDVFKKDKTWVCSICKKGSNYKGLGDLFGPYFDEDTLKNGIHLDLSESIPDRVQSALVKSVIEETPILTKVRAKRKRSELVEDFIKSTMTKKEKIIQRVLCSNEVMPPVSIVQKCTASTSYCASMPSVLSGGNVELWAHEDCLVWSHGVYLLGPKVVGLRDAINEASGLICSKCHESGATVGCLQKGCSEQYHYMCAKEKGCHLNEENFTVYCAKHRVIVCDGRTALDYKPGLYTG